jgi:hypothetical protein
VSSFNRTLADVLHVRILRVPSQATDVIIILMMMVALKLADRVAAPTPMHRLSY